MRRSSFAILALGLLASPAHARDALPLKRGIYVEASVPCAERSNATVTSFWGDRLNTARTECVIQHVTVAGSDHRFTCRKPWNFGPQRMQITAPTAFTEIHPRYGSGRTAYRWCADAM